MNLDSRSKVKNVRSVGTSYLMACLILFCFLFSFSFPPTLPTVRSASVRLQRAAYVLTFVHFLREQASGKNITLFHGFCFLERRAVWRVEGDVDFLGS